MRVRQYPAQTETHLHVLRRLHGNPDVTQRQLSQDLRMSLGAVNYCLHALVEKGWVKIQNLSRHGNKLGYAYLLTPAGVAKKTALTKHFLRRKIQEYAALQAEIEMTQKWDGQEQ